MHTRDHTARGLTRAETASQLRVSLGMVDKLIKAGSLQTAKIGRRRLVNPSDVNRLLPFSEK